MSLYFLLCGNSSFRLVFLSGISVLFQNIRELKWLMCKRFFCEGSKIEPSFKNFKLILEVFAVLTFVSDFPMGMMVTTFVLLGIF